MAFTFFFRDAETLELAIDQMLPAVRGQNQIDIWDAGCAHGPEPYTLAILLREKMSKDDFVKVRIHATDVDECFAAQVTEGSFPESELRRLPAGYLEKYFVPNGDASRYRLIEEIRSKIVFSRHDLLSLKPFGFQLSMIVCKNVLLHFNEEQRRKVLKMFHAALRTGGILVTENTQKIPAELSNSYRQMVCHAQVHEKVADSAQKLFRKDPPENVRQPYFRNKYFKGSPENGSLEMGGSESA
jgi:chemotaxis protein methyltransferase CheR